MRRPPLSEAWDPTFWGKMWGFAVAVMVLVSTAAPFEGWSLDRALIIGLICGPGHLVLLTFLGVLCWAFSWGFNDYPW
jgi:hypothetical protein